MELRAEWLVVVFLGERDCRGKNESRQGSHGLIQSTLFDHQGTLVQNNARRQRARGQFGSRRFACGRRRRTDDHGVTLRTATFLTVLRKAKHAVEAFDSMLYVIRTITKLARLYDHAHT